MIKTSARVIAITNGKALVEPKNESGCGGCKSNSTCAVSGLGKYFSNNREAIAVQCGDNIQSGDELDLSMSELDFLKAGLLVYLAPSLMAIIGAVMANAYGFGDVGSVVGMLLGFIGGLTVIRLLAWVPQMNVHRANNFSNQGDAP